MNLKYSVASAAAPDFGETAADGCVRCEQEIANLASFLQQSPDPMVEVDFDGAVTYANPAAERLLPDLKALSTEHPWLTDWASVVQSVRAGRRESCITREVRVGSRWYRQTICLAADAARIRIYGSDISGLVGAVEQLEASRDAAENARAELERLNQALQTAITRTADLVVHAECAAHDMAVLLASIPSVLIGLDAQDRVLQWNGAAEASLGVAREDAVGRVLDTCGSALDWGQVMDAVNRCRQSQTCVKLDDLPFRAPDGRPGLLGLTLNPTAATYPGALSVLILGADITERRSLEAELAQAHKLESIGQLAAGIAHEINTPTQFVADNLAFLDDAFHDVLDLVSMGQALAEACRAAGAAPDTVEALDRAVQDADWEYLRDEIPRAITQSKEGVQRVAGIVQAMKEFSHPGVEAKVRIDLNHAIETTVTVARHEWRYAADVELDLDPALPPVPCYPGEVNQVILNLVVNAAHAIAAANAGSQQKGRIRVATRRDGGFVELQVADTGTGIPAAIRHRVFDPFFTTKEVGRGTGQGLAIAHSVIVDKHGGSIHFDTREGVGTTFFVRLPLDEE